MVTTDQLLTTRQPQSSTHKVSSITLQTHTSRDTSLFHFLVHVIRIKCQPFWCLMKKKFQQGYGHICGLWQLCCVQIEISSEWHQMSSVTDRSLVHEDIIRFVLANKFYVDFFKKNCGIWRKCYWRSVTRQQSKCTFFKLNQNLGLVSIGKWIYCQHHYICD